MLGKCSGEDAKITVCRPYDGVAKAAKAFLLLIHIVEYFSCL